MYDLIKTLVAQLVMPLPLMAAVFVLGLVMGWLGWRCFGATLRLGAVAGLLALAWSPVADRLLAPLEARYPAVETWPAEAGIEAVVVLGGGWQPDRPWPITGRLNESSTARLMEGVRLWRQAADVPLVVSGASRRAGEMPIAHGYAEAAEALGVPARRLRVLDTPTDTGKEARAVRAALGEGARVLLVTSASHMARAVRHFRAAGLAPVAAPTHYLARRDDPETLGYWVPSARHLHKSERAIYEGLGMIAAGWEQ